MSDHFHKGHIYQVPETLHAIKKPRRLRARVDRQVNEDLAERDSAAGCGLKLKHIPAAIRNAAAATLVVQLGFSRGVMSFSDSSEEHRASGVK